MRFAQPLFFLLLLQLVPLVFFELKKKRSAMRFSDLSFFKKAPGRGAILKYLTFALNVLVLVLVTIGLARPQKGRVYEEIETKGVDIVMCLDISISMLATDFTPKNRLFAAKSRAKEFIEKRPGDRIGLVVFAGAALTQCPLTFDHGILKNLIDYVDVGILDDGTAIGMGLATAVGRLKDSKAKEKIIILLTDGANNRGEIDPVSAAKIAQTYGIKVYCIGVGQNEPFQSFINHPKVGRGMFVFEPADMNTLNEIATLTDGKAFRASDDEALKLVYDEIDELEPTTFKTTQHTVYAEKAGNIMFPAVIVLLAQFIVGLVILRRLP